jgi:hypothetical protein
MELGPDASNRRRASSLARPFGDSLAAASTAAGTAGGGASGMVAFILLIPFFEHNQTASAPNYIGADTHGSCFPQSEG